MALAVFVLMDLPRRSWAQAVAVRVTSGGLALTTSHAVGRTPPGGTVPNLTPPSRLVTQDVVGGWAIVQNLAPETGDDPLLMLREQPRPQQRVRIQWSGNARDGVVEQSTPAQIVVRFLQPGTGNVPEGAAVLDTSRRLVGVVANTDATRVMVIPVALAISDLRAAAEPPVAPTTRPRVIQPEPRRGRMTPIEPHGPASLPSSTVARVREAALRLPDDAHPGIAIQGDRMGVAFMASFPTLRPGCNTEADGSGAWVSSLLAVEPSTGIALLRLHRPDGVTGLPIAAAIPTPGATLFVVPMGGRVASGVVVSATDTDLRVRFVHGVDAPTGVAVVDVDGRLVGLFVHAACEADAVDCEAAVTPVLPLRMVIGDLGNRGTEAICPAMDRPPSVPPSAIADMGAPGGAFAIHVGSDGVYATLANRLHDVASGCLLRAPGYLHGEVLGVDEIANVAVFHTVAPNPAPDVPTADDAPLVLGDRRPAVGRPVRAVVSRTDGDPLPMLDGIVTDAHGDDLLVDFGDRTHGVPVRLVQGSPVIDGDGRVVGLVDRVVVGNRFRVRSAAAIRRLLETIRRESSTSMCFPTFGATQGFVTALAVQLGVEGSTVNSQGSQYNLTAGVFWYNTWYFRGELGLRLGDEPMPRISLAGGPLVFRTAGDGELGVGLHIELDAGLTRAQGRADVNGAQRALYAFEVHGMPYVTNHFGLIFALAMGIAQFGDLTGRDYGFGLTYTMGVVFGSLRHDRP